MGKTSVWKIITFAILAGLLIIGGSVGMGLGITRSYNIEVSSNIEQAECNGGGRYKVGDDITFETNNVEGYRFVGWELRNKKVSTENPYTFKLTKNKVGSYTAHYEKEYTVAQADTTNGEITLSVQKAIYNEEISITINSADGYEIDSIYYTEENSEDNIVINGNKFHMPRNNITVHATFKLIDNQE